MTDISIPRAKRKVPRRPAPNRREPQSDLSNFMVPPAMLIAAIAMGVASNLHLGIGTDMAIAVGAALFCAMLLCHVLLRAADIADRAEEEAAERRMSQVASPMPLPERLTPDAVQSDLADRPADRLATEQGDFGRGLGAVAAQDPRTGIVPHLADTDRREALPAQMVVQPSLQVPEPVVVTVPIADAGTIQFQGQAQGQPALVETPVVTNPAAWTFRPVDLRAPSADPRAAQPTSTEVEHPAAVTAATAAAIGSLRPTLSDDAVLRAAPAAIPAAVLAAIPAGISEADRIDAILKRLAQQIKAGTPAAAVAGVAADVAAAQALSEESIQSDTEALAAFAATRPDSALASAVEALRSTVEAMRQGGTVVEGSKRAAVASPPSAVEARLAAVTEALAVERVDVVLAPILALAEAEARHFEVYVRLRGEDGELFQARDVAAGVGLLPLLDALSVRYAAGFALKLERRGRGGAVFSSVAGESLQSEGFVGDVAGRYAQGIADRMVLSFAQTEMRGLGPAQLAALGELSDLGFRFSLTGVADLDMDFEALKTVGFQFVKLDAAVFLGGLPCGGVRVPASDLCLHFADMGIEVIVSGIGDERQRDSLLGCGVAFGQGPLYGEPRPIPFAAGANSIAA